MTKAVIFLFHPQLIHNQPAPESKNIKALFHFSERAAATGQPFQLVGVRWSRSSPGQNPFSLSLSCSWTLVASLVATHRVVRQQSAPDRLANARVLISPEIGPLWEFW